MSRLAISPAEFKNETFGLKEHLDEETIAHLRRVFVSRTVDDKLISDIGIRHTRGILLNDLGTSTIPPSDVANRICMKLFNREPKRYDFSKELEKQKKWVLDEEEISFMEDLEELLRPTDENSFPIVLLENIELLSGPEALYLRHCLDAPSDILIFATVQNSKKHLIDPSLLRHSRFEVEVKLGKRSPAETAEEYLSTHFKKDPNAPIPDEPLISDKTDCLC